MFFGLCNKDFFENKILKENFNLDDIIVENVIGDGNCGFRSIALQIYNNQHNYSIVRTHIYNFLNNNKDQYSNNYMIYNNEIISADNYIPLIRKDGLWMGDLEISVIHIIYDCILYLFEINNNFELHLINIYGNDDTNDKILLNLCFVNNNHYIVLYERNRKTNIKSNIKWNDINYLNNEYNNDICKNKYTNTFFLRKSQPYFIYKTSICSKF